jgi:serine/threonine-protein kinase
MSGVVWTDDPPLEVSGMTLVELNPLGRLTEFVAVPPQIEQPSGVASSPDWRPLFSAAGLDPTAWLPAQPMWTPPSYSDARAAWTGSLAERPSIPMRIEAAAYRGKPVYFELIGPWSRPKRMQPYQASTDERTVLAIGLVLLPSVLMAGAVLAQRNLRLGRGDRRGAFRLAAAALVCRSVAWVFGAHHVPSPDEFALFVEFLVWAIAVSALSWVLYIAVEPYVRRRWPATLVSWTRLLAGGLRDPLVGRDLLLGCLLGAFSIALVRLGWFVPSWLGHPPPQPYSGPEWQLLGARTMIAYISNDLIGAPVFWIAALFVLFLLRVLLRKQWAAVVVWVLVYTMFRPPTVDLLAPVIFVTGLISTSLTVWLLIRFGLLAVVAGEVMNNILGSFPLTTQGSVWYASMSLAGIVLTAAVASYGFYTCLGGRAVFGSAALEE